MTELKLPNTEPYVRWAHVYHMHDASGDNQPTQGHSLACKYF